MFFLFFLLIIFAIAAFDWLHLHRKGTAISGWLWVLFAIDALPLATTLLGFLFDNTVFVMRLMMWITWAWLLLTLPRLAYYLFTVLRLRPVGVAVAAAIVGGFIWGTAFNRKALYINRVEICSERLPESFDGLRIAHFADLHIGNLVEQEAEIGAVVEAINAEQPDLVCFTGDLVNIRYSELNEKAMRLLQQIEAPVYSILGNHDVGSYIRKEKRLPAAVSTARLIERQEAMGWQLLQDTTIYLRRGADSISLTGLAYDPSHWKQRHDAELPFMGGDKAYADVPQEPFNLTLVHVPQLWEQITAHGYGDLSLAGHTHAMQMKIRVPFGKGRTWSPAAWLYEHWSGRYESDGKTLYVNDGIGYVGYPMRLGAAPELTLITLKRCK